MGARDPGDAAVAYYDLGVLEAQRRRFDAARDAFLDALALAPDDAQARFNLEWSLRALTQVPAPPEQRRADDDGAENAERPEPKRPDPERAARRAPGQRAASPSDRRRRTATTRVAASRPSSRRIAPSSGSTPSPTTRAGRCALRRAATAGSAPPRSELSRW